MNRRESESVPFTDRQTAKGRERWRERERERERKMERAKS